MDRAVNRVFLEALELPEAERAAYLLRRCSQRPRLRREVESLLVAVDEVPDEFLDRPPLAAVVEGMPARELASGALRPDPASFSNRAFGEPTWEPGDQLGRYEVIEHLGSGGMGEVYRARDTKLKRDVALKVLIPNPLHSVEWAQRLRREAKILAGLSHPNLCILYDHGVVDGIDFLAMEFVTGQTLADRLHAGALSAEETIGLGIQIAGALEEAHRHGVVHRDLKPGNIMLSGLGEAPVVKLLDFGIAKSSALPGGEQDLSTRPGLAPGTMSYMSPEQLLGREIDGRSDLFSFGVVLHEMLVGQRPFTGSSFAKLAVRVLQEDPPPLVGVDGQKAARLGALVQRCLEKHPEDRWQSAGVLLRELQRADQIVSGEVQAREDLASVASRVPEPSLASNRGSSLLVAVALLVLGAAALGPTLGDRLLYPLIGIVGAIPLLLLIAAIRGCRLATLRDRLRKAFSGWVGGSMGSSWQRSARLVGLALGIVALSSLSLLLSYCADLALPTLRFIPHPVDTAADWSMNHSEEWDVFRGRFKNELLAGSGSSERAWQDFKADTGRWMVRATRTLFLYAVLLGLAGLADLARRNPRRGGTSLLLAAVMALLLYSTWFLREGDFVKEVVLANQRLPADQRLALPGSAPEALKSLVRDD